MRNRNSVFAKVGDMSTRDIGRCTRIFDSAKFKSSHWTPRASPGASRCEEAGLDSPSFSTLGMKAGDGSRCP
jgi:hypothetical protein